MLKEYIEEREGTPYVAGTRVSLASIVTCFREGMSAEAILEEFETLTLAQVYGAIAYYLDNQAAVDAGHVRSEQRSQELRRAAEPLPARMLDRIGAARARVRSIKR